MDNQFMPRRHIYRNGVIAKRRVKVFAGLKLPDPKRDDTLSRLRRLVSKHFRAGLVNHASIAAAIDAIKSLLSTYKPDVHEYEGYPRNVSPNTTSPATEESRGNVHAAIREVRQGSQQVYVSIVDPTAPNDAEYLVLKRILAPQNPVLLRASVKQWLRTIAALESDGHLTSVEMYVVEYALVENAQRRAIMANELNILLFCLMEIRKTAGKDLFLHIGYNAAGFENPVASE